MTQHIHRKDRRPSPIRVSVAERARATDTILSEKRFHLVRVELPIQLIDVDERRPCTSVPHCVRWSDEGKRRKNHFVVGANTGQEHRDMEGGRARRRCYRVAAVSYVRELRFESLHERTGRRYPASIQAGA